MLIVVALLRAAAKGHGTPDRMPRSGPADGGRPGGVRFAQFDPSFQRNLLPIAPRLPRSAPDDRSGDLL
jgi:hypothetical protein